LYHLPSIVGEKKTHPLAYVVGCVLLIVASSVTTQVIAYQLHFNPSLGKPLWHTPLAYAKLLYAPYAWCCWLWRFENPLSPVVYPQQVNHALAAVPYVFGWGVLVAIIGTIVAALLLDRTVHVDELIDSAKWAELKDLKREGLIGAKAGLIIGGFETKFGIVPIRYDGELGISYTGPPGDGKSALLKTCLLIPLQHEEAEAWSIEQRRAHPWGEEPSIIVLDVKGNLVASTSQYQATVLDKQIFILEPLGSETEGRAQYNPFWGIQLGSEREADDCYQASLDIVDVDGKGLPTYWDKASTAFGGAAIAKIGYRSLYLNDPSLFSLPGLVDYISSKKTIDELINDMLNTPDDPHGVFSWKNAANEPTTVRLWIADVARAMKAKAEEEKSGVYGSFIEFLAIYRSEVLRKHITASTFSFKQLANSQKAGVVYINVPAMRLDALRPYLRMITRSALRELTESTKTIAGREVRGNLRSTIVALDEVAALKHVEEISTASGFLRGHGVILLLFWQALNQLHRLYGNEESIRETIDVHIFGRPKTFEAAKLISDALGQFSTLITKRNISGKRVAFGPRDHLAEHADITTRNLLTPSEVMRFPKDRAIIFVSGLRINARKFAYYLNSWLQKRSELGAVLGSDVMTHRPFFLEHLEAKVGIQNMTTLLTPLPEPSPPVPPKEAAPKKVPPKAAPSRALVCVAVAETNDVTAAYATARVNKL
jgi:type IV secretion system protein VirD4